MDTAIMMILAIPVLLASEDGIPETICWGVWEPLSSRWKAEWWKRLVGTGKVDGVLASEALTKKGPTIMRICGKITLMQRI
jgi:hypothetical protein